jgi:hypothetical protein
MGSEDHHYEAARAQAEDERGRITGIINNLLDNITPDNREYVDERLRMLTEQRRQLETRLEELDHLAASQAEIKAITDDAMKFLSGLELTLHNGLPQEKLTALRQCIQRIRIDRPAGAIGITTRSVPCADLAATQQIDTLVSGAYPARARSEAESAEVAS